MALTFQCGLLLFVMGWLNLGFVVRFISQPVLSGFTSAAALMTIVSVFKDLLGANVPRSQVFQGYVVGIVNALPRTDAATLITGLICIALLHFLPTVKRLKKIPGALLVVILSIICFAVSMSITGDTGIKDGSSTVATRAGIALVGPVPSAFPMPQFPSLGRFFELIPAAVSVSFVGYIERCVQHAIR
jgi:SulP family sulfate permease